MAHSRESTSDVSLANVLLRDCPGKWLFVTQGLGHARGKSQNKMWDFINLFYFFYFFFWHSWGLYCNALFSLSAITSVWGLWCVIYNAFVKDSRDLQMLIYYHGLNKVKCGCCRQRCFIWQWLIGHWACWQASCSVEPWTVSVATIVPAALFLGGPNFNLTQAFVQAAWPPTRSESDVFICWMCARKTAVCIILWVLSCFGFSTIVITHKALCRSCS